MGLLRQGLTEYRTRSRRRWHRACSGLIVTQSV